MNSAAASTEAFREVPLGPGRIDACLALSAEAGWNQVAADWQLLLTAGTGTGLENADGALVASSVVLPLGPRVAWIGMVLVTAAARRQGLATRLMRRCQAICADQGRVAGLDATPAGREVYRHLGFREVARLSRLTAEAPRLDQPDAECAALRAMKPADLPAVAAYDRGVIGANRAPVLRDLQARQPDTAVLAERDGAPVGYALARDGRTATQIGPLVAETPALAQALFAAAARAVRGPVLVDAFDSQHGLRDWLDGAGFAGQRPFVRMLAGEAPTLAGDPRLVLAAGPELG
jgi:GNAT superfamily N-acetyltransferase